MVLVLKITFSTYWIKLVLEEHLICANHCVRCWARVDFIMWMKNIQFFPAKSLSRKLCFNSVALTLPSPLFNANKMSLCLNPTTQAFTLCFEGGGLERTTEVSAWNIWSLEAKKLYIPAERRIVLVFLRIFQIFHPICILLGFTVLTFIRVTFVKYLLCARYHSVWIYRKAYFLVRNTSTNHLMKLSYNSVLNLLDFGLSF